jgi:hypothetical protein
MKTSSPAASLCLFRTRISNRRGIKISEDQLAGKCLHQPDITRDLDLVSELFHRINKIIPVNQLLLIIPPEMAARDAIALLQRNGYSQVPVVLWRSAGSFLLSFLWSESLELYITGSIAKNMRQETCWAAQPQAVRLHE